MNDPYSLANLNGIIVPEPPPLWPPTTAVWLLLACVAVAAAIAVIQYRQHRKRNAYRRAGLATLAATHSRQEVRVVLKRVALAAFPRAEVASLYDDDWLTFLQNTGPDGNYAALIQGDTEALATQQEYQLARCWILRHRAPATADGA